MPYSFCKNIYGEEYIFEINGNRFQYSKSKDLYEKYYTDLDSDNVDTCVIIGADSGLLIHYLNNVRVQGKSFFIFDKDDLIDKLKQKVEADNISIMSSSNLNELLLNKKFKSSVAAGSLGLYKSFAVVDGEDENYYLLYNQVKESIRDFKYRFDLQTRGARVFMENSIVNCVDLLFDVKSQLENKMKDQNVLVLSAGPSLAGNVEWIKKNRDSLIVIAVSRIAGFLIKNKITPDYFVAVDPYDKISFDLCFDAIEGFDDIPLIVSSYCSSKLIANWKSDIYYLGNRIPWHSDELNPDNWSTVAPTVSQTSISIALQSGAKNVFLIGVDLCYGTPDSGTHVEKKASIDEFKLDRYYYDVTTYEDKVVKTELQLLYAIEATDVLVRKFHGVRVYNISKRAAKINSIEYMDPDVASLLLKERKKILIGSCIDNNSKFEKKVSLHNNLSIEIGKKLVSLTKLTDLLSTNQSLFEKSKSNPGDNISKLSIAFNKLDLEIKSVLEDEFFDFCKRFGMHVLLNLLNKHGLEVNDVSVKDFIEYNLKYIDAWKKIASDLEVVLKKALLKINVRKLEASQNITKDVVDFWCENIEFNRFITFNDQVDDADKSKLINVFVEYKNNRIKKVPKSASDLKKFKESLLRFLTVQFDRRDLLCLKYILQLEFEPYFLKAESTALKKTIVGITLELEAENDAALKEYEDVITIEPIDKECSIFCLKRILDIALSEDSYILSMQALDCLSLLNPLYLRKYGEFLLSLNMFSVAVDKFVQYHEFFPNDLSMLKRLILVFRENGYLKESEDLLLKACEFYPGFNMNSELTR